MDYATHILLSGSIEQKLISPQHISFGPNRKMALPAQPGRDPKIKLSEKKIKFPRGHFHVTENKAIALHSFANHELLACEMMAAALLIFPHDTDELKRFKRGIISSLRDEQLHFQLYVQELNRLGYEFGDFPLNGFFWQQMGKMNTPAKYLSVMSLTFEAANLDFASHYEKIFRGCGDIQIADVLNRVLKDELSHVAFGVRYLNKWRENKTLWDYYLENLPWPITPARSKGKIFERELRLDASMSESFIDQLVAYESHFSITNRREWKH